MYSVHYAGSGNEDDRNDTVSRVIKQARSRRISVALRHDLDLYFVFNVIFICICAGIICICNIIPICIPICICICICRNDRVRRVIKQAGRISIALGRDLDAPSVAPTWRTLRAPWSNSYIMSIHCVTIKWHNTEHRTRNTKGDARKSFNKIFDLDAPSMAPTWRTLCAWSNSYIMSIHCVTVSTQHTTRTEMQILNTTEKQGKVWLLMLIVLAWLPQCGTHMAHPAWSNSS